MVILMTQQKRWHRRDAKRASKKRFTSDNRNSVRTLFNIMIDKAKKIREKEKNNV